MKIDNAKRELYKELRQQYPVVSGAGIREKNGREFIVVFLSKADNKVIKLIPKTFKGNPVKTEIRPVAKAV